MPARMPIGVPSAVASVTITSEPKMALASPPTSACGGGVISVSTCQLRPPTPSRSVSNRIQISQNTPNAIAPSDSVNATALTRLRRRCSASLPASKASARRHDLLPSPRLSCISSSFDSDSTTKVMKNNTRPR